VFSVYSVVILQARTTEHTEEHGINRNKSERIVTDPSLDNVYASSGVQLGDEGFARELRERTRKEEKFLPANYANERE
jgi:hypothetical protein